jgi:2-hydroxychromene-2-carboxylate isomerase
VPVRRPGLVASAGNRAARFKIGRHVLFEESDVRAWIKAHGIPARRRKDADRETGW